MNRPEILAPVGSMDALTAAVRCGADAVYLGGQTLNARRAASGFDADGLCRAGEVCHAHGAKLYITLNTLTFDTEMPQVHELLRQSVLAGADGLIVQDLGVARLARACCDIPLHASTQMSVQTGVGVEFLRRFGFVRAVLPRELSRAEIAAVRRETSMELEMFVHGALCMCVSGQCLMSAVFGERSGNRGLCAQPCRLPFAAQGGTGHDLSLKDLSLLPVLRELAALGIDSFKIEGRLKRPEYVAAAVTACRAALDGASDADIFDELRSVFSRSGFTDGYYTGKTGVSMFGTRQKDDVTAAKDVLPRLQSLYAAEPSLYPVTFTLVCRAGEASSLTASTGTHTYTSQGDTPTKAQTRALDGAYAEKQLAKCGGTLFFAERIDCRIDDGLFLPASALNAMRRDALDGLLRQIVSREPKTYQTRTEPAAKHTPQPLHTVVRFADETQIPDDLCADAVVLPLYCGAETIAKHGAVAEIPRALMGREEAIRDALRQCRSLGVQKAAFASADGLALALECGMEPVAFFGSNVFNSGTLEVLRECGVTSALLSPELPLSAAKQLGGSLPRGVWVYGRLPLMLTRNCPQKNGKSCRECRRTGSITDRKGVTFPIECRTGFAEILNAQPTYLPDKQNDWGSMDFALLYFTKESREECSRILRAYRNGSPPDGAFTRGLAYRGVL